MIIFIHYGIKLIIKGLQIRKEIIFPLKKKKIVVMEIEPRQSQEKRHVNYD